MAQIEETNRRNSKIHSRAKMLRVDLTPMVDLGFLLITFFILTTTLSQPVISKLIMPKDSKIYTYVKKNAVLTLLLKRNDSVACYEGDIAKQELIVQCTFKNLRIVVQQKQQKVAEILGDRDETVVLIIPGKESSYGSFVKALDEIQINDIKHYYIVDEK